MNTTRKGQLQLSLRLLLASLQMGFIASKEQHLSRLTILTALLASNAGC